MRALYRALCAAVTGLIFILQFTGIGLEWCAARLVPAQKFLIRKIEGARHG